MNKMKPNVSFLLIHMQHLFSRSPALEEQKFILLIQVIICSAPAWCQCRGTIDCLSVKYNI